GRAVRTRRAQRLGEPPTRRLRGIRCVDSDPAPRSGEGTGGGLRRGGFGGGRRRPRSISGSGSRPRRALGTQLRRLCGAGCGHADEPVQGRHLRCGPVRSGDRLGRVFSGQSGQSG
ncbi:hypothetical protein LTR94_034719, partial [Friedmanniomyces endolithicus]